MDDYSISTNIDESSSKCDSPTQNRASALLAGLSLIEKNQKPTTSAVNQKRRVVGDDFLAAGDSAAGDSADVDSADVDDDFFFDQQNLYIKRFKLMTEPQQDHLMKCFLLNMNHVQLSRINEFLSPMLQRDFIDLLIGKSLHQIVDHIFSFLDAQTLCKAEMVSGRWRRALTGGLTWKKSVERKVCTDRVWCGLSSIRDWRKYLFKQKSYPPDPHLFYKLLFARVSREIANLHRNWTTDGRRYVLKRIVCQSEGSKGVYCLQYDDDKIVAGLRDDSIRIWDKNTLECRKVIVGHSGSVLCLQYDDHVIISGSSDATVRVWDVNTGEMLQIFEQHKEAVLHLKFANGTMVTCSKDKTVAVWDMQSPTRIVVRKVLFGHRAAVNVVDFDDKYIVSASGDRTIQVWCMRTFSFVRTLNGHRRGIACLQYKNGLVISGSSDFSLRIWDVELGVCLRVLEGHRELIRCLRFDDKRIISGSYDGAIKIWDLEAALNPKCPSSTLCVKTLTEHTGRVFRLQFDDFQLVSSSHDDSILIWDFLNFPREDEEQECTIATV